MITITPVHTLDAVVTVPGSKSLTQRALIAAALAAAAVTSTSPAPAAEARGGSRLRSSIMGDRTTIPAPLFMMFALQ